MKINVENELKSLGISLIIAFSRIISGLGSAFLSIGTSLIGTGYEIKYKAKKRQSELVLERLENE